MHRFVDTAYIDAGGLSHVDRVEIGTERSSGGRHVPTLKVTWSGMRLYRDTEPGDHALHEMQGLAITAIPRDMRRIAIALLQAADRADADQMVEDRERSA